MSASTTTKGSHDPYRASRTPIVRNAADQALVVIRQGSAEAGVRHTGCTRGLKHLALSRLQTDQLSSLPSRELEKILRQKGHSHTPGTSQSSLASYGCPCSDAGIQKSASYKRHVSFQHHRKRSLGTGGTRSKLSGHQRLASFEAETPDTATQTSQGPIESQSTSSIPAPSYKTRPRKPTSECDLRKSGAAGHYWKDEARKVSTELGKICEEAFNRSSISSCTTSQSRPDESAATLISTHSQTAAKRRNNQLENRPLPHPPAELLGPYTLRERADTRRRLLGHRRNKKLAPVPAYVKDIITHLGRLIEADRPESIDKRSASDPNPVSSQGSSRIGVLPRHLNGIDLFRTREHATLAHDLQTLRAASDPTKSNNKVSVEGATIRPVSPDSPSPVQTIQPLNIRRNKVSPSVSTLYNGSSETPGSNFDRGGCESRFYGPAQLGTIEEDPISPRKCGATCSPRGNRKWSWFKRNHKHEATDDAPIPPMKHSPVRFQQNELETGHSQALSALSIAEGLRINNDEVESTVERQRKWFQKMFSKGKANPTTNSHEVVNDFSETESEPASLEDLPTDNTAGGKKLVKNYSSSRTTSNAVDGEHSIHISQNWLAKSFHVRPATKLMTLSVTKARARNEIIKILKGWRKYGLTDVVSEKRIGSSDLIRGRVDDMNGE
jgi:serine/threonine-protein kinase HSL1 (negative regulator of Swe1 kinase)